MLGVVEGKVEPVFRPAVLTTVSTRRHVDRDEVRRLWHRHELAGRLGGRVVVGDGRVVDVPLVEGRSFVPVGIRKPVELENVPLADAEYQNDHDLNTDGDHSADLEPDHLEHRRGQCSSRNDHHTRNDQPEHWREHLGPLTTNRHPVQHPGTFPDEDVDQDGHRDEAGQASPQVGVGRGRDPRHAEANPPHADGHDGHQPKGFRESETADERQQQPQLRNQQPQGKRAQDRNESDLDFSITHLFSHGAAPLTAPPQFSVSLGPPEDPGDGG